MQQTVSWSGSPAQVTPGRRAVQVRAVPETTILGIAEAVVRRFARRRAPGDLDDVRQDAVLEQLVVLNKPEVDLDPAGARGYLATAARRAAGLALSRALSQVSFPEKRAEQARDWQDARQIVGCGVGEVDPDDPAGPVEIAAPPDPDAASAAELRLRIILRRHVDSLPADQRRAATIMLGIDVPAAEDEAEAAFRAGVSPTAVRRAVRSLEIRVGGDPEARRLRRVMLTGG